MQLFPAKVAWREHKWQFYFQRKQKLCQCDDRLDLKQTAEVSLKIIELIKPICKATCHDWTNVAQCTRWLNTPSQLESLRNRS